MKNIARLFLKKYSLQERQKIMESVTQFICSNVKATKIIFFGSITTENFDDQSDVDVIVVFKSKEEASLARKILYTSDKSKINLISSRSVEFLCVDQITFDEKSKIGGVYFIAKDSGISYL